MEHIDDWMYCSPVLDKQETDNNKKEQLLPPHTCAGSEPASSSLVEAKDSGEVVLSLLLQLHKIWKSIFILNKETLSPKPGSETLERGGPCWLLKLRLKGTQRVQMKGGLSWLVSWALRASTRDLRLALAALVGPVQSTFILTMHHFNLLVPIAQHAGQAVVLGHLSLSVCPCSLYNSIDIPASNRVFFATF